MRTLRWLLVISASVLVSLTVSAIILYVTFDAEDHRGRIVKLVEDATGRTVRLEGTVSLTFFPSLAVELGRLTLENPPGFPGEHFAVVDGLAVQVAVLPLLQGHLVVDRLEIGGATLALHRREDGRDNWSDLAARAPGDTLDTGVAGSDDEAGWLRSYGVKGLRLNNGAVSWRDDMTGARYLAENLEILTGGVVPGASMPIAGGLRMEGPGDGVTTELRLRGTLNLSDHYPAWVKVPDLHLSGRVSGGALPLAGLESDLSTAFSCNLVTGAVTLADLSIRVPGGIELSGRIDGTIHEPFGLEGTLVVRPFSPRGVLEAWEFAVPPTTDPAAMGRAEGSIRLKAADERLVISPVHLHFDDTRLDGNMVIMSAREPAVDFVFDLDRLDVDRYLPPAAGKTAEKVRRGEGQNNGTDLGALGLMARGTVSIGTLIIGGATVSNIRFSISGGDGAIDPDPPSGRL